MGWISEREIVPDLSARLICDYLINKFKSGYSTNYVNSIKCAINFFTLNQLDLENNIFIKRLFKYFYQEKPVRARYLNFWPVHKLLSLLSSWYPISSLSLKSLTLKTIALIALSSSDRGQTLHMASTNSMVISDDKIQFVIREKVKNTRKKIRPTIITCISTNNDRLNVLNHIKAYIDETNEFRTEEGNLFLSWVTKKPVSKQTLAHWLKLVRGLAGIDTGTYKGIRLIVIGVLAFPKPFKEALHYPK